MRLNSDEEPDFWENADTKMKKHALPGDPFRKDVTKHHERSNNQGSSKGHTRGKESTHKYDVETKLNKVSEERLLKTKTD